MKLNLPRLSLQKGSSLSASFSPTLSEGESLTGYKVSAYIKGKTSDVNPVCVVTAKVDTVKNVIELSVVPPTANVIPAGQLFYYVEVSRGLGSKFVERNYLNVEP